MKYIVGFHLELLLSSNVVLLRAMNDDLSFCSSLIFFSLM